MLVAGSGVDTVGAGKANKSVKQTAHIPAQLHTIELLPCHLTEIIIFSSGMHNPLPSGRIGSSNVLDPALGASQKVHETSREYRILL